MLHHAVGNYHLTYSWECFLQKIWITCSSVVDNPKILGNFLLFVEQDQLGENYLTHSHIWGARILLVESIHYILGIFRPLPLNHVYENFLLLLRQYCEDVFPDAACWTRLRNT